MMLSPQGRALCVECGAAGESRCAVDDHLWQVTTIAPGGRLVTTHGHTTTQAVREMLRRRSRGHTLPTPCATPEATERIPAAPVAAGTVFG
jgi:hypothetical protein